MRYHWQTNDGTPLTEANLARFVAANAHRWYEAATALVVTDELGTFNAGADSVHREDAFVTATEHYGVDYDVFYDAWVDGTPINAKQLA
jgi:hypothetical protein